MQVVNNFNCRGFGPLLEDKLCLIFKLAPSVCRMTFPILASLLVRLVVLLPFQLLRLSLATPSRWTPRSEERFSRNAETDLVCRLLLEKKKEYKIHSQTIVWKRSCMDLRPSQHGTMASARSSRTTVEAQMSIVSP